MLSWDEYENDDAALLAQAALLTSQAKPASEPLLAAESMTDATPLAVDVAVPPLATSITSAAISAAAPSSAAAPLPTAAPTPNSNTAIGT